MTVTTGQKLSNARIAKGLSVEEVAHATKLRPDKVLALEHDDYSRFPNNAYVKGFLQLYARYLGVDVRAALSELENPSPVSVSDYQYLNSIPVKEPERLALRRRSNKPSIAPLIVFVVLCLLVGLGGYLYLDARRLGDLSQLAEPETPVATPTPAPLEKPAPAPVSVPPTASAPEAEVKPEPEPSVAPTPQPVVLENVAEPPMEEPVAVTNDVAAADQEFIAQAEAPGPDAPAAAVNEVVIEPVRKTWVTVRTGDMSSTPIFEDFLYTNAPALKLRGPRFFIEVRDEGAVNIRKNGLPIAYQGSGVTVQ
jgi:cytoskeletal protein RodZ